MISIVLPVILVSYFIISLVLCDVPGYSYLLNDIKKTQNNTYGCDTFGSDGQNEFLWGQTYLIGEDFLGRSNFLGGPEKIGWRTKVNLGERGMIFICDKQLKK